MKLYVVRHGHKQKGAYFSDMLRHEDEPLSDTGDLQARSLADYFADKDIKRIYATGYIRTQQTAKYVSEAKGIPITIDERANEIDTGAVEKLSWEEIRTAYPDMWKEFKSHTRDFRYPGGETGEEVRERQDSLLKDIAERNEDALLICHDGFIRLMVCNLLGAPIYHKYRLIADFCGVTELEYDSEEKAWCILKYNHTVC